MLGGASDPISPHLAHFDYSALKFDKLWNPHMVRSMACATMGRHTFSFDGGEQLTTIGATFLVSYLYYRHVDSTHRNWETIKTKTSRISTITNSEKYHRAWLERIGDMNDANLSKNTLGLDGAAVKVMARAILKVVFQCTKKWPFFVASVFIFLAEESIR